MFASRFTPRLLAFAILSTSFFAVETRAVADPSGSYLAVLDESTNNSDSRKSVTFFDAKNVLGGPLFSVFVPFENGSSPTGTLYEEPNTISVNPTTGDIYLFAFDNISPSPTLATQWDIDAGPDGVNATDDDTTGDWDIYRINFQTVLNHWKTNYMGMDARTVVGPAAVDPDSPRPATRDGATATDLLDYVNYGVVTPYAALAEEAARVHKSVDGGVHDASQANQVKLGSMTVAGGAIEKVGEVNRNRYLGSSNFHLPLASFIDADTLFLVDDARQRKSDPNIVANDYDFRIVQRLGTTPGAATDTDRSDAADPKTTVNGGFNRTTTESWISKRIDQMKLDDDEPTSLLSDPQATAVHNGTVRGVWVADRDLTVAPGGNTAYPIVDSNNGDDIAFLQLNPDGTSAGYREITASPGGFQTFLPVGGLANRKFEMDNDPKIANDNLGRVGKLFVDSDTGDLIVIEEGFQDSTPGEPAAIRVPVNYDSGGKIQLGAWSDRIVLGAAGDFKKDRADLGKERGYWSGYDSSTDTVYFVSTGESAAGDFNNNGLVDAADYVVWRDNEGVGSSLSNRGGLTGTVGQADYDLWAANFGKNIAFGNDIYALDLTTGLTSSFMNVDESVSLFINGSNPDAGDKVVAFSVAPPAGATVGVPEPTSLLLVVCGVIGFGLGRRRTG